MAFSQIARAQMRDPLGNSTGMLRELQQLEDLLTEVGQGSILDAVSSGAPAPGAILDEGGAASQLQLAADNGEDAHSEMSEPTDAERVARQLQLDTESAQFLSTVGQGVFNTEGEGLC